MKVFRKELFLRDNVNYIPVLACETPWWEKCDGVEVYHDDDDLPNVYHANVNGDGYVFLEKWCEEIEDANKNKEAIKLIEIVRDCGGYRNTEGFAFTDAFNSAIESLEKTADKECSRCVHRNKCAIFDNFNIDYCSDWSEEE